MIGTLTFNALVLQGWAVPALASEFEHHSDLVRHFVLEDNAYPVVADCAAHAAFVIRTTHKFDHVEFPAGSFDSVHSSVIPWTGLFDSRDQRVMVDEVVTVVGLAMPRHAAAALDTLIFRCGYRYSGGDTLLYAFSWSRSPPPQQMRTERIQGNAEK
ncbi:hypothetical protein LJR034_003028 [Caballeronia sp. LjRoot34]|uniref:BspC domain-containing protein n=1 Tax=Caballeronia sp. LjRoot34 TaxID=3342325 RepID=UPI003ECDDB29